MTNVINVWRVLKRIDQSRWSSQIEPFKCFVSSEVAGSVNCREVFISTVSLGNCVEVLPNHAMPA